MIKTEKKQQGRNRLNFILIKLLIITKYSADHLLKQEKKRKYD